MTKQPIVTSNAPSTAKPHQSFRERPSLVVDDESRADTQLSVTLRSDGATFEIACGNDDIRVSSIDVSREDFCALVERMRRHAEGL